MTTLDFLAGPRLCLPPTARLQLGTSKSQLKPWSLKAPAKASGPSAKSGGQLWLFVHSCHRRVAYHFQNHTVNQRYQPHLELELAVVDRIRPSSSTSRRRRRRRRGEETRARDPHHDRSSSTFTRVTTQVPPPQFTTRRTDRARSSEYRQPAMSSGYGMNGGMLLIIPNAINS